MRDGRTTLGGGVEINQGSMRARAVDAEIQTKEGAISTVVLNGAPATLAQTMDDGQRLDAEALRIRYDVGAGLVVLEGKAKVTRGLIDRFEGARIEYEPDTALIRADGQGDGPVTFRFQPSSKPAAPVTTPEPTPDAPASPPKQDR
jgi:lipopolysaccharide export system protein LptA